MKRWDDFLQEEPSRDLTARTEAKVFAEMKGFAPARRGWLQFAAVAMGIAAVVGGYRLTRDDEGGDLAAVGMMELAEEDEMDLDILEDLDVIEILEELEEWQTS